MQLCDEPVTTVCAARRSVLHYVVRTNESVILRRRRSSVTPLRPDPYIRQRQARSILCLPLINQGRLNGVLYLENNLTPRVFLPARITVLKLLASQAAAISSLENSRLYLQSRGAYEAKIRRLVDANIIGIFHLVAPRGNGRADRRG